ncbi:MAG: NUDIX domain-containing protein [Candidatus Uhrbacteria bacterium]
MPYERSVGAVIFRRGEGEHAGLYVLLLRYPGGYWEFPRGHVEAGEHENVTARREIREETGITQLRFLPGFRTRYRFRFQREGRWVTKDAVIYLAEVTRWNVRVSEEHLGYVWVPIREAIRILKFENARRVIEEVAAFLARPTGARVRVHSSASRSSAAPRA